MGGMLLTSLVCRFPSWHVAADASWQCRGPFCVADVELLRILAYLLLKLGKLIACCAALQDEVTGKDYWVVKNSW